MSFMPTVESRLSAGEYLRKRREAARLTIADVAAGYATGADRDAFAARLNEIEADRDAAGPATLDRLFEIFRFDAEIYRNLVSGVPAGTAICRGCACSWTDACVGDERHRNCHWAEPDLCSQCALPASDREQEPSFNVKASDRHAIPLLMILSYMRLGNHEAARRALEDAIGEDQMRQRVIRFTSRTIDAKGGEAAAAAALDVATWRDAHRLTLPGEVFHV